jgi:peroxiredoxin
MKHTTRLVLTVSALTGLLTACQAEHQEKPAHAGNGSSAAATAPVEAPAPKMASATPAAHEAPVAEAPAPTLPAPAAPVACADPAKCADMEKCAAAESTAPAPVAEKPVMEPGAALVEGFAVGQRMPSYKNTVRRPGAGSADGEPFDTHATKKPTLYIANSTTCPYCTVYIDRLKALETAYMAKGVDIVHVYPVREQTAESKIAHHAAKGYQGGLITDQDAAFAKALDIHKTPTAILADASGKIVYRGRIDDNAKAEKVHVHELADAIDATLAGKTVQVATTEPFG